MAMAQSTKALALALRGLAAQRAAAWAGLSVRCRDLTTTSGAAHVQAAPAEEEGVPQPAGQERWRRELGAVRTDWT